MRYFRESRRERDRHIEDRLRREGVIGGRLTNDPEPNQTYLLCDCCDGIMTPWTDADLARCRLCGHRRCVIPEDVTKTAATGDLEDEIRRWQVYGGVWEVTRMAALIDGLIDERRRRRHRETGGAA